MISLLCRVLYMLTLSAGVLLMSCSHLPASQTADISASNKNTPKIHINSLPPDAKNVIKALLASSDIPLSIDQSCHQAGTDLDDKTLGDFLSGLLSEQHDPNDRNSVNVETIPVVKSELGNGWIARVMVGQSRGEVVWQWGVEFFIRQDGVVDASSYRCRIAG